SGAPDGGPRIDPSSADSIERAGGTVRVARSAPGAAYLPCGTIESTGTFGIRLSCHGNHVIDVVQLGEPGPEEHAPDVHVVGDIASRHLMDGDAKVAFEDLYCHGSLLLADARELVQTQLKKTCRWLVGPDAVRV